MNWNACPVRRGRRWHRGFLRKLSALDSSVAVVNDALVREYFPSTDVLGRLIRVRGGNMPWLTVVGVAGDLKHTELMNEMKWVETPNLYRPLAQDPRQSFQIAVRARGDAKALAGELHKRLAAFDPRAPAAEVEPLASRFSRILAYPRFRAMILGFFALSALVLSTAGIYGVLSQFVSARTPEMGLRRAVGAQTHHLLLLIARQAGIPVLAGLATGMAATSFGSRVLAAVLYGSQSAD